MYEPKWLTHVSDLIQDLNHWNITWNKQKHVICSVAPQNCLRFRSFPNSAVRIPIKVYYSRTIYMKRQFDDVTLNFQIKFSFHRDRENKSQAIICAILLDHYS